MDNYVKKFEDFEKRREEDYNNSMSKIMLSNVQKEGEINLSAIKTTHHGIQCNMCKINPIVGYRYKCSICKDYNLCENCEQINYDKQEHKHDFIKMRNAEKLSLKPEQKKKEKKPEKKEDKKEEKILVKPPEKKPEEQPKKIPKNQIEYKFELLDKNPESLKKTLFSEDEENKFEFGIVNTSNIAFPGNGKTKFIIEVDKKKEVVPEIIIDGIKAGENTNIIVNLPKKSLKLGEKKISLFLNIDGKNIGNEITFILFIKSKKVQEFRKEFNLNDNEYEEQQLFDILQKHNFINVKAFESMFQ